MCYGHSQQYGVIRSTTLDTLMKFDCETRCDAVKNWQILVGLMRFYACMGLLFMKVYQFLNFLKTLWVPLSVIYVLYKLHASDY